MTLGLRWQIQTSWRKILQYLSKDVMYWMLRTAAQGELLNEAEGSLSKKEMHFKGAAEAPAVFYPPVRRQLEYPPIMSLPHGKPDPIMSWECLVFPL